MVPDSTVSRPARPGPRGVAVHAARERLEQAAGTAARDTRADPCCTARSRAARRRARPAADARHADRTGLDGNPRGVRARPVPGGPDEARPVDRRAALSRQSLMRRLGPTVTVVCARVPLEPGG